MRIYKFSDEEIKLFNTAKVEADRKAQLAADEWLEKAIACGPKYSVHSQPFGQPKGPAIDYMLDVCGNAYLRVTDMRTRLAKYLVQQEYYRAMECGRRYFKPSGGYYGGVRVDVNYKQRCRQEMGLHEAAVSAAREVYEKFGLKVTYKSYID